MRYTRFNLSMKTAAIRVIVASARPGYSQNARFYGQITDFQSAAVTGANVQIVNEDTGTHLEAATDASGTTYSIPYLTAGHYKITVTAQGFDRSTSEVTLGMGQALNLSLQLSVGRENTTVNVQASSELPWPRGTATSAMYVRPSPPGRLPAFHVRNILTVRMLDWAHIRKRAQRPSLTISSLIPILHKT